jgi:hypothetical protein
MSNSKLSLSCGGITLWGLVFIVFLVLKLAEVGAVANWSWWWVTAPLWIPFAIFILLLIIWLIVVIISELRK